MERNQRALRPRATAGRRLSESRTLMSDNGTHERGSMYVFLIAALLPLLFVAFMLLMDLGGLFTKFEQQQEVADSAALLGTRFLPHVQGASAAVQRYLAGQGYSAGQYTVSATSDQLNVQLRQNIPVSFAEFFGADLFFPLSVVASAKSNYRDAVVVVDNSSYLAPDIIDPLTDLPSTAPWAGWPAAQLYGTAGQGIGIDALQIRYRGQPLHPAVLSQQCLNEDFAAVKRAAIVAYDHLSARSGDATSLIFVPGPDAGAGAEGVPFVARGMVRAPDGARPGIPSEAVVEGFYSPRFAYGDLHCAMLAEEECVLAGLSPAGCRSTPASQPYLLPDLPPDTQSPAIQSLTPLGSCDLSLSPGNCLVQVRAVTPPELMWNQTFRDQRTAARQAIWGRSVRRQAVLTPDTQEPRRYADIVDIIRQVEFALLSAPTVAQRAGLSPDDVVLKRGIILLGDVPGNRLGDVYPSSGMDAAVISELQLFAAEAARRNLSVQLSFVVLGPRAHSRAPSLVSSRTMDFAADAQAAFNSPDGKRSVAVFLESDPVLYAGRLMKSVLVQGRTSVVSF